MCDDEQHVCVCVIRRLWAAELNGADSGPCWMGKNCLGLGTESGIRKTEGG